MSGVNATNCRVFALCKTGTLGGNIASDYNVLKNNNVTNCYVENYKCNISETFDSGTKTMAGFSARATATFYPQGEVGGMYGFIKGKSTISNCHITDSTIYANGQSDKKATITGSTAAKAAIKLAGLYTVPGRHVGKLIGDIRVVGGNITITNCTATNTNCTLQSDKHNNTYDIIGRAYYVLFVDTAKTLKIDGEKVTLFNAYG